MSEKLEALKKQADDLGISYASNIGEETLQKKINETLGKFDDSQGDTPETPANDQPEDKPVTIHLQEDETNPHDVQVGVNGKVYLIQRGQNVEVPRAVYEVLKDSVEDHYDTKGKKTARQSYPFTLVSS